MAAALALCLALAGCGDDSTTIADSIEAAPTADETAESITVPGPSAGSAPSTPSDGASGDLTEDAVVSIDESAGPGEVRSLVAEVDVGETAYYAGFDVQVGEVSFGFDPAGFRVALVSVTLTNRTPNDDRLQTAVEITSGGNTAVIDRDLTPEVPSGGAADGAFSLRLDPTFTIDDAVLLIGRADRQRAEIPLGSSGTLVTREPQTVRAVGSGGDEISMITIDAVTVAWDSADPRGQAEPGQAYLHVEYTLDTDVETAVSRGSVVVVPDGGPPVEATIASTAQVEPGSAPLTASFLVADPVAGDYVLRYTERFGRGEVEVDFTLD